MSEEEKVVEVLTSPFVEELRKVLVECYNGMVDKWREDCTVNVEKKLAEEKETVIAEARRILKAGPAVKASEMPDLINKVIAKDKEEREEEEKKERERIKRLVGVI